MSGSLSLSRHSVNVSLYQSRFIKRGHLASMVKEVRETIRKFSDCLTYPLRLLYPNSSSEMPLVEPNHDVLTPNIFKTPLRELPSEEILLYSHILLVMLFSIYPAVSFSSDLDLNEFIWF